MAKWIVSPLLQVGNIELGASREDVRHAIGLPASQFKKTPMSENTTDDYRSFHVYYDQNDRCEAVEIFDGIEVEVAGKAIFPASLKAAQSAIQSLQSDGDGLISREESIGIYAPAGTMESILFGVKGYYE